MHNQIRYSARLCRNENLCAKGQKVLSLMCRLRPSKTQYFNSRVESTMSKSTKIIFRSLIGYTAKLCRIKGYFQRTFPPRTTGQVYLLNRRGDYQISKYVFFLMDGLNAQLKRADRRTFSFPRRRVLDDPGLRQDDAQGCTGIDNPETPNGSGVRIEQRLYGEEKGWCGGRNLELAARRERRSQGKEIRRGGTNCEEKIERMRWLSDSWSL